MTEQELRLECLRLASATASASWEVLPKADDYYRFLTLGDAANRNRPQPVDAEPTVTSSPVSHQ